MSTATSASRSILVHGLVTLALLAGLAGCGPASSDEASSIGTSMGGLSESQPVSQHTPSPQNDSVPPPKISVPLASNHEPASAGQEAPSPLPEYLVLPEWIARALDAPEIPVRLRALDMWAQQGAKASLDPLVVALDDEDEDVRAKAMAIIERHWAVEPEAEPIANSEEQQ